jgi:hypothetical protein
LRLIDSDDILTIELESSATTWSLVFAALAYRKQDEGSALRILNEMSVFAGAVPPFTFLVRIFDSAFLEWFSHESGGIYNSRSPHHYRLLTINSIVEVLCLAAPEITERSA